MSIAQQLALSGITEGCNYGLPRIGERRPCDEPATHVACWQIPATYLDGTPNPRHGAGRVACCLPHANYYATAWVPMYPYEVGAAWIEPVDAPTVVDVPTGGRL